MHTTGLISASNVRDIKTDIKKTLMSFLMSIDIKLTLKCPSFVPLLMGNDH
jgi:hypothetical protein